MTRVFSTQQAVAFIESGQKILNHNRQTIVTPAARDLLVEAGVKVVFDENATYSSSIPQTAPQKTTDTKAGGMPSSSDEALFNSPEARRLKDEICDIGRRMWMREYCDGNGGNISARLAPDRFLVTPTGVSKGFMKPEMICMVDLKGNQLAGSWKRSSEFTTHAAIYETVPQAASVCHAHPCHAGAFAIKELEPPPRLIPELEVFVGQVAVAGYQTPGSPEMAGSIRPLAPTHQSIIMGCHGVICWGLSVEDAYFKMEITDAYCRTVILAQNLPGRASIPCEKMGDLLEIKKKLGLPDNRFDLKPVELCEVDPWVIMSGGTSAGCSSTAPACGCNLSPTHSTIPANITPAEVEDLVQKLTDEIFAVLKQ